MYFHLIVVLLPIPLIMGKVCKSIDVRNSPQHISEFSNCRIIEGHLQVVLMENVKDDSEYFNWNFRELHEITEYLLIFRVMNLTSLDVIFPNLTTIGGIQLFQGFSLVVYNLPQLERLGLESLRRIGRGGVLVQGCPNVCYVDTVNWKKLGASAVNISAVGSSLVCENEVCLNECAGCWNNLRCQNFTTTKCHPACIGCSKVDSHKHCDSCKYFNDSGSCVQECPLSKITDNHASRCLTAKQCTSKPERWSIYNNTCVPSCPMQYRRSETGKCVQINKTWCKGIKINYATDLENLVGCTHINGSLEIQTSEEPFGLHQLEQSLGKIEYISEYLKIVRSLRIKSMEFFKRLRTIKGRKLWSGYYAVFVAQNQNLQELWTVNTSLVITRGEVLFQDNPHLCAAKIYDLTNRTVMLQKNTTNMIHVHNNGQQLACNTTKFNVRIAEVNSYNVTLAWDKATADEVNNTVGFTVYYIEALGQDSDSSILRMKDDCDGYGWSSIFTRNNSVQILDLKVYQQYAYYIRIQKNSFQTIQTPLGYFRTASCEPSGPVYFEAVSATESSITLQWERPNVVHKELTHYGLAVYEEEDYAPVIAQRNYCHNPICTCPKSPEIRIFLQDELCTEETGFCMSGKYNTAILTNAKKIVKREVQLENRNVQEFKINANALKYKLTGLHHYTLYIFYLKACENQNCSQPEMAWQRTDSKEDADVVTYLKVLRDYDRVSVLWMEPKEVNAMVVAYNIEYKRNDSKVSTIKCIPNQEFKIKAYKYDITGLGPGTYAVRIGAVSLAGPGLMNNWRYFKIQGKETSEPHWLYGVLTVVGFLFLIIIALAIRKRCYSIPSASDSDQLLRRLESVDQEMSIDQEDEWMLDRETVEIIKKLQQDSLSIAFHR